MYMNFNRDRENLTDDDKQQIFELFSKGLREKNRNLLHKRIFEHTNMIPFYGIFERIMKEPHGWSYCAGQSYTDEITHVRKLILECR